MLVLTAQLLKIRYEPQAGAAAKKKTCLLQFDGPRTKAGLESAQPRI